MEITVEKNKKRVQRFSLDEILDNNFQIPDDLLPRSGSRRYRDVRSEMNQRGDIQDVDSLDIEDLI